MFDEVEVLSCPICTLSLRREAMAFTCDNHHNFDVAREGYVNLLRKPLPADNKEMLNARRAFLEEGHYRPLLDLLGAQVIAHVGRLLDGAAALRILDAGCGEGYYLGRVHDFLAQAARSMRPPDNSTQMAISSIGIDLSKEAARMAAKRYREPFFVVSNLKERLPLQDGSMDIVLNIFAPRNVEEYSRVLAPGGLLLIAIPGPHHLQPLREQLHLLNIEEDKQQHVLQQFSSHFQSLNIYPLTYEVHLTGEQIEQVVKMTPNYWHQDTNTSKSTVENTKTTIDFVVLALQKKLVLQQSEG